MRYGIAPRHRRPPGAVPPVVCATSTNGPSGRGVKRGSQAPTRMRASPALSSQEVPDQRGLSDPCLAARRTTMRPRPARASASASWSSASAPSRSSRVLTAREPTASPYVDTIIPARKRSSRPREFARDSALRSSTIASRVGSERVATVEANPNLGAQIVEDAKEYVLYSWSTQDAINPIAVAGAEGRYFWDYEGKRYLDFASQLVNVNIGHQHPKIIAAIKEQADRLCTIGPPMASESRSRLGRLLEEVTPGDLCMSFFTNSGAEANENAIKLARLSTGRHKIVARYRSYHGATHGSILLTGDPRRWPNEPGMGGVVRMLDPYTYRCPAGHPGSVPRLLGRAAPRGDPRVRGRAHGRRRDPRDRDRDERGHPAAARLPAGDPRGLRPARDPADPRRGHGRLRAHRPLVRLRELGRRPGHHHRGEGDQLGLRPARRDDHPRAPEGVGARPVLPGRADVRGSSARVRVRGRLDRGVPGGGRRRERGRGRRVPRRRSARPRRAPPVDRRRARPRVLLGRRAREEPRDARDARALQRVGRGGGSRRAAREGVARARPLPHDALERDHGRAAADDHARRGRRGARRSSTRPSRSPTSTSSSP